MKLLLSRRESEIYENCVQEESIRRFSDLAKVDVGIVTGANSFFLVDDETVEHMDYVIGSSPCLAGAPIVRHCL